jgi:ADP-ribose pyrophosphatase YjhB (NUDIX family)
VSAERDPRVVALLDGRHPAAEHEGQWARPMRLTVYIGAADLPDDLVTSIRVIVRVGDDVVVCTNLNGDSHVWPGGRREPGETHTETACREVHEETGWLLDPTTIEPLGFMVAHNRGEPLPPYPHPDVLQVITTAVARERAADDWTDTEGFETSSRLLSIDDALVALADEDGLCAPFLELLRARA